MERRTIDRSATFSRPSTLFRAFSLSLIVVGLLAFGASGCLRSLALGAAADALSSSGNSFGSDDDPELIRDAAPFALKTMESLVREKGEHVPLLTSLAAGFTQYGYAFVMEDADARAEDDIGAALFLRRRAAKLFARAQSYATKGLSVAHSGLGERLSGDLGELPNILQEATEEDVPLLYWLAASSALRISASRDEPEVFADYPRVRPIAERALALNESWGDGAIHDLLLAVETGFPGGSPAQARAHFERAVELSHGGRVGTYLALAEGLCVKEQNAVEFRRLLEKALAVDLEILPHERLGNIVMKRRAERLKKKMGDLFLDEPADGDAE